MNASTTKASDHRIRAMLDKSAQTQAALEKRREKLRRLIAEEKLQHDPTYLKLEKEIKNLRGQLHRLKLAIGRKKYSLEVKTALVEQITRELGKQENKKHELESKLQSLDEKAVAIHEKAISQAEDTIHTQTTRRRRKT